ncbi:hypothetical protein COB57_00270 [Candidatus Peregrinibacteria bacterium]|nr:MAG: hypothetical protein COB57_00270 [Candidatus Peregrinibacteria bacterium]
MMEKMKKQVLQSDENMVIYIKVKVRASKTEIIGMREDGIFKMNVRALPESGKANEEILKLLKKHFSDYCIKIQTGKTSSMKTLLFTKKVIE